MAFQKKARAGLLLFLTAGPFLVFLFLYLFGKNHFELDRYKANSRDFFNGSFQGSACLLLLDTGTYGGNAAAMRSQLARISTFWEDLGEHPQEIIIDAQNSRLIRESAKPWFNTDRIESVQGARENSRKRLPAPPRAFLFDENKTLRGIYGLTDNKSVDTLMLEYRILIDN